MGTCMARNRMSGSRRGLEDEECNNAGRERKSEKTKKRVCTALEIGISPPAHPPTHPSTDEMMSAHSSEPKKEMQSQTVADGEIMTPFRLNAPVNELALHLRDVTAFLCKTV
eukprot:366430-Chlamydomonas_euryale.AAC.20